MVKDMSLFLVKLRQYNVVVFFITVTESNKGSPDFSAPTTVHVFFLKKLWVNSEPGKNKNADSMFHFPQVIA